MTTSKGLRCYATVYSDGQDYRGHNCTRKVTVERGGLPYCNLHDPEAKQERQKQKTLTTCQHYSMRGTCGKPAVGNSLGSGFCALHDPKVMARRARLEQNAEAMYEVLKAYVRWLDEDDVPDPDPEARAVLARIEGTNG